MLEVMTARRAGGALVALALLVLGAAPASCNPSGVACAPGDYQYCDCPGARGYQTCLDDGSKYGACDCSGTIPRGSGILVEAGTDADAEAGGPDAKLGFLAPCSNDVDCETNLCFAFNAYGPHCSHSCSKITDCPAPSPGCSNMGVCKIH